jgi:hypothetical protein
MKEDMLFRNGGIRTMRFQINVWFISAVIALTSCSSAFSAWTVPVPLSEVNTQYGDGWLFLSSDGLTLYFSRWDTPDSHYAQLYQSVRSTPYGAFTSVTRIDDLAYSAGHVRSAWVSPDNLRMYFFRTEPGSIWKIKKSTRETASSPWGTPQNLTEINNLGDVTHPKLSSDELAIVFNVFEDENVGFLYTASRRSRDSVFTNIREISELNISDVRAQYLSPDGLTLYFVRKDDGVYHRYMSTRVNQNSIFGTPELINYWPENYSLGCFSADGKTAYLDGNGDIYVSYYVSDNVYYVDGTKGNNSNSGISSESAFATIQKAVDAASDGYEILVKPGVYSEPIDFKGKAITIQGIAGPDGIPVLETPDDFAVTFTGGEAPDSILKNIVIKNSFMGIFIVGSSPTIKNVTIVDNIYGINAYFNANPDISNCIFWNNASDILGCEAKYSWMQNQSENDSANQNIPGLVHYWSFDEGQNNILHDSIADKNGDIQGATWTEGVLGSALSFDGIDDYVALPDNNPIWLPQNNFTVSFFVNFGRDHDFTKSEIILDLNFANSSNPENDLGYDFQLYLSQENVRQLIFQLTTITNTNEDLYYDMNVIPHQWYHVTIVRDGTVQAIYIDGQLIAMRECSPDPIKFVGGYDDDKVNIGRYTTTIGLPRAHFMGKLDELMMFDRALSSQEIVQLYENKGNRGIENEPLFADPANGDYHLKSERGRYWPEHDVWVLDKETSPCIDAGDPNDGPLYEPMPNGGSINMGAYGGTAYASMSEMLFPEPDFNKDGIVDGKDLDDLIQRWLDVSGWIE